MGGKINKVKKSKLQKNGAKKVLISLRPDATSMGYALFLASNATIIWGGVFPFLPLEFQNKLVTSSFFVAQALAFALGFVAYLLLIVVRSSDVVSKRNVTTILPAIPYVLGWACLIAAMYTKGHYLVLSILAGTLIGFAVSFFMMSWIRLFASLSRRNSAAATSKGLLYAPILYVILQLVPNAIAAFMVPLICMPLFLLSLFLSMKKSNFAQPMFETSFQENKTAYLHSVSDYWRIALGMAAIGFCCGAVRSFAIVDASVGTFVNYMSMAGALLSAIVLYIFWNYKPVRFNLLSFFRICFPALVIAFTLLPFLDKITSYYFQILAGVLYAVYTVAFALVIIQCIQASRSRKINPLFVFGIFGGIIYLAHDVAFIIGQFVVDIDASSVQNTEVLALCVVAALAIIFFICQGGFLSATNPNRNYAEHIELIQTASIPEPRKRETAGDAHGRQATITDRISKQCRDIALHYGLSKRESEIMEYIVRGNTIKRISEELLVSENTVSTHVKRLYVKLGIHKKQQLRDMVESANTGK